MTSFMRGFPTEFVNIIKQDGTIIKDVKALVSSNQVTIDDSKISIVEGDTIERSLPNGDKEFFQVTDRGFFKGMGGIPDHYQVKFQKITCLPKNHPVHTINNYHISGSERVNIHSIDQSETYHISLSNDEIFDEILDIAKDIENNQEILTAISKMRQTAGQKSFLSAYNNFIQSAANHMTVFAPFIPALTHLLTH